MADVGRRPLRAYEKVHTVRLGQLVADIRRSLGLTQEELALRAALSRTHVSRLERGTRRTRQSTLRRVAAAFVVAMPELGPVDHLVDELVREAGPALSEESDHAERVTRRRGPREDRAWRDEEAKIREYWLDVIQGYEAWAAAHWSPTRNMDEIRSGLLEAMHEDFERARATRRDIERLRGS